MPAHTAVPVSQLSFDGIKELAAASGPCLSIFLPADPAAGQKGGTPSRVRHAIEAAEHKLAEKAVDPAEARHLIESLREAAGEGLALFRSFDVFRVFALPEGTAVEECVELGDHFYVKPLLPLCGVDHVFYILALSQKHIRLLRCTTNSSEEVPLPNSAPTSLHDDMQTDQPDHDLENRGGGGPSTGSMKGVMFTTSTAREDKPEYMRTFYKHVSEAVTNVLKGEKAPLVIAGVDYETALFRRENTYPHLAENAVHGAPDGLKGGEMHKRALEAVAPYFEAPLKQALARYEQAAGSEKASSTIREIVAAAFDGRVADLMLDLNARYMGNFDEATHRVRGHKQPLPGDEDLLNAAAVQTILHSGQVFVVPANKLPNGAPAVAVMRY